jgi:hypothetical protein
MKSKRFISFIAIMLLACNNTSTVLSITNKSSHKIDSIIVTSNGVESVYAIEIKDDYKIRGAPK